MYTITWMVKTVFEAHKKTRFLRSQSSRSLENTFFVITFRKLFIITEVLWSLLVRMGDFGRGWSLLVRMGDFGRGASSLPKNMKMMKVYQQLLYIYPQGTRLSIYPKTRGSPIISVHSKVKLKRGFFRVLI